MQIISKVISKVGYTSPYLSIVHCLQQPLRVKETAWKNADGPYVQSTMFHFV